MHATPTTANRTTPFAAETPLERIESHAAQIHGDTGRVDRAYATSREHDRLHDDAADLCERAILAGDARTALRAIRSVKRHDADEDGDLSVIPERTDVIRGRTRQIAGTVESIDTLQDAVADLLTAATAYALREGAQETHELLLAVLPLIRQQNSQRARYLGSLRITTMSVEQMQGSTDRILGQMRALLGLSGSTEGAGS